MCRNVKTLSICPTCGERLSERTTPQWCKEGRRKGVFGRCAMGVRCSEEEFRGEECRVCVEVREAQMSQMQMSDFNVRRLGWRTYGRKGSGSGAGAGAGGGSSSAAEPDDSDGGGYCW